MTKERLYSHAKEQEGQVRNILASMADATTELDCIHEDGLCTSAYIDYDEQDAFNAIRIFFHVAGNYAIKHGKLKDDNVYEQVETFKNVVMDVFGIDTVQEAQVSIMLSDIKKCMKGGD